MKEWSSEWKGSTDPGKQRKYRANAPTNVRRSFLAVHLSKELKKSFSTRSVTVRKGDSVVVMRGGSSGLKGDVTRVDYDKCKVYVDSVKHKKVDGTEVQMALEPSNLMITKLATGDKQRQLLLDRKSKNEPQTKTASSAEPKPKTEKKTAAPRKKARARPKHMHAIKRRKHIIKAKKAHRKSK